MNFTSLLIWKQGIVMSVSVCLLVCLLSAHIPGISGSILPNFTEFSMHIAGGHGLVLLGRHCDMLCTSSFVDDVMFARNLPGKGNTSRTTTQTDSTDSPGEAQTGVESDIYDCLVWQFDCCHNIYNCM